MNNSIIDQSNSSDLDQQLDFLGLNEKQVVSPILHNTNITKADIGRSIWNDEVRKMNGQCPVRSTTIRRLMDPNEFVGCEPLTKAGAATYYQNMKKKAGFVNSK